MATSVTDGISMPGTNSGRMTHNVPDEGKQLRYKFAGKLSEGVQEGQNVAAYYARWGIQEEEGNPYMKVGKPSGQAAPVVASNTAPAQPDVAQLNKMIGKAPPTVDFFSNEGVG